MLAISIRGGLWIEGDVRDVSYDSGTATFTFTAHNAIPPVRWSISDVSLPTGWSFNNLTGVLTVPTDVALGKFSFKISAKDSGPSRTKPRVFEFRIISEPIAISGDVGPWLKSRPVDDVLTISGGAGGYTNLTLLSGALPGVEYNLVDDTVVFSAYPDEAGSGLAILQVEDSTGKIGQRALFWSVQDSRFWVISDMVSTPSLILDHNSSITESSGDLVSWEDQSANGWDAEQEDGNRPVVVDAHLNGKRVIDFPGLIEWLDLPLGARSVLNSASNAWALVVFKNEYDDSSPVERALITVGTSGDPPRFQMFAGNLDHENRPGFTSRRTDAGSDSVVQSPSEHVNDWVIMYGARAYSDGFTQLDVAGESSIPDLNADTGLTSATDSSYVRIGANAGFVLEGIFNGKIAAILLGNTEPPTADELEKVFAYYAHEYNLLSLIAGSEYEDYRPLVPL